VNAKDEREKPVSKIVLEQILVLAVAQEANRDETKPKVVSAVTLELTPDQAERLDLARSIGNLSLVLRNQLDTTTVQTVGVRSADLLSSQRAVPKPAPATGARAKPAAPAKPAKRDVEMIRGVHKSSVKL